MTRFGIINADGSVTELGEVSQADMLRCPHCIMVLEHYRADGSCRCDDPTHIEMREWGYRWDDKEGKWTA